jgi:release factor glutamine methyltransferase
MANKTVETILDGLIPRLEKTSDTPGLDANVVLARVLEKPRSWVVAHPEAPLTRSRSAALEAMVARLEKGEPLPYVLGRWEFFSLEFEVTPDVLIPRPETEMLVERALAWLRKQGTGNGESRVLDVGTGSGCIAIALAVNVADLHVTATDISPQALAVARRNAEKNHVLDRVTFLEADLIPNPLLPDPFSLIVANLPYIPTKALHRLPIYGREPTVALDGGMNGLVLIRKLLSHAPDLLPPGGLLLMEIEASEGPAALSLAYDAFSEAEIHLHKDLTGRDRLLEVQVRPWTVDGGR